MNKYHIEGDFDVDERNRVYLDSGFVADGDDCAAYFVKCCGTEIKPPVTYKVRDRFCDSDGRTYVLCGSIARRTAYLLTEDDCLFWKTLVNPVGSLLRITESEFDDICDGRAGEFTKIEVEDES